MRLYLETTAREGHHSVALYAMEIKGDFYKVSPSNDTEDIRMKIGPDRWLVGGTLNWHTHASDTWEIGGELVQFIQTASAEVNIYADGDYVNSRDLGPKTVAPSVPTGSSGGLQEHELYLEGAGIEPTGTFLFIVNGEFLYRDDPGEIVLELADGWYLVAGHIAGGTDTFRFVGSVEQVVTGGSDLYAELDGQPVSWSDVVSITGGSGSDPPSRDPCDGVSCPPGEECVDGVCISTDPCDGVTCPPGDVCVGGGCVPEDGGGGGGGTGLAVWVAAGAIGGYYLVKRRQ